MSARATVMTVVENSSSNNAIRGSSTRHAVRSTGGHCRLPPEDRAWRSPTTVSTTRGMSKGSTFRPKGVRQETKHPAQEAMYNAIYLNVRWFARKFPPILAERFYTEQQTPTIVTIIGLDFRFTVFFSLTFLLPLSAYIAPPLLRFGLPSRRFLPRRIVLLPPPPPRLPLRPQAVEAHIANLRNEEAAIRCSTVLSYCCDVPCLCEPRVF